MNLRIREPTYLLSVFEDPNANTGTFWVMSDD